MLKFQDFRDQGYNITKTEDTSPFEKEWATWLIQKRIQKGSKIKYFINIYVSDSRFWKFDIPQKRTFSIKLFFQRNNLNYWIEIQKNGEFQSVEDIELLVEEIWKKLKMNYYD